MNWKAVLFDATGTLIELREPVALSYARFARAHGIDLPSRRIDEAWKRVVSGRELRCFPNARPEDVPGLERAWWHEVVRATFRASDSSIVFPDFDAFFGDLFEWYATAEAWRTCPGVETTLAQLRDTGLRLGVISDFDYRLTDVLESLGIADLFDAVILAGPVGATKPDPRLFAAALAAMGLSQRDAVYVGDDPARDLAGAEAAGLASVDVASLESFTDLPNRLATL